MSLITQVEVDDVEFEVEFNYTPSKPGKFTGPWESSYPDEPAAIELEGVYLIHFSSGSHINLADLLSIEAFGKITEKLLGEMESGDE